jgi:hypothetical protein
MNSIDVDAPVSRAPPSLEREQHIQPAQQHDIDREEVHRQDSLRLGSEELIAGLTATLAFDDTADQFNHGVLRHRAVYAMMSAVRAVEVWLAGGPADSRLQLVETDATGGLPTTVVLPQTGLSIGADDDPAPRIDHVYRRAEDIDGQPVNRYASSPPRTPFT